MQAAVHESGHAVIGIVVGVPHIQQITLMPPGLQDRVLGVCITGERVLTPVEIDEMVAPATMTLDHLDGSLAAHLICRAAGAIAERRYVGRRTQAVFADGGWRDGLEMGQLLASAYRCQPYGGRVQWLLDRVIVPVATRHVAHNWSWITRTAAALLVRRQLTRDDIVALKTEKKR